MHVLLRAILLCALFDTCAAATPAPPAAATPCVFVPSPTCPVAVAANATHSCFPFRLCNPGIADVNTSVWHECKFAAHFREACQEYLVFDYLLSLIHI